MDSHFNTPVFCEHCANLATAELDDSPVCMTCMLASVRDVKKQELDGRINPLPLRAGLVKSKRVRKKLSFEVA